jgi:hypothetical protein
MPMIVRPADPSAVADASPYPAPNATLAPNREDGRWFSLRGGERAKKFALSLRANARWMKRFLHGSK